MKRKAAIFSSCFFCFALVTLFAVQAIGQTQPASNTEPNKSAPIPMDQLGTVAGKQYHGDGLSVAATPNGARLRCAFQRLEGHVTHEGLWLSSTADTASGERFRVMAVEVGRADGYGVRRQSAAPTPLLEGDWMETAFPEFQSGVATSFPPQSMTLPVEGSVLVKDQTALYIRDGLTEEYTVSVDGVRQDFIVEQRPGGEGELRVELDVTGAKAAPLVNGVRLVLDGSGRKLAYNRLRVLDATGRELPARMEVAAGVSPAVEGGILPPGRGARTTEASGFHCDPFAGSGISAGLEATALRQAETPAATRLAVLVEDAAAIYPVRIDPTFSDVNWISMGGFPGTDVYVYAAVADGSGNLYIGGFFVFAGEAMASRVAKWNGSNWSALGSGIEGGQYGTYVYALAVSGSDLYAGGIFTTAGGIAATNIARWNGNSWSALSLGIQGSVRALAVSGSNLYAGGIFTTAGGAPANNIAKWDGSNWSVVGPAIDPGIRGPLGSPYYGGSVYAMAVSGSDLYAGGFFTTAGGVTATNLAKWDGSNWSALDSRMNGSVLALAVSGTNLYAGGGFTTAGGTSANRIAKWNGSSWSALGSGIGGSVPYVDALAVLGNDLYVGGEFTKAGGNTANYIARWNGSNWLTLGSGMGGTSLPKVHALAVSGGDLYAGGSFGTAGGTQSTHIAKWKGSSWSALGSVGMDTTVSALAISGSDLYAGGAFTVSRGSAANYIARWNGNSWSALGSGMNNVVYALTVSGSDLYAGGFFTTAGGVSANNIAKWNGSSWSALGSGMDSSVFALAMSGSDVYAGGGFTTAGGISAIAIAKWDGSNWSALGLGLNGVVTALAVSGSDLYAGGLFTTAGGVAATNIAKWNGSSWSALGSGMEYIVYALAVSGSDLYAGGIFATAGGIAANYIAKWDGSTWSALGSGMNLPVYALAVSGSNLYAGGNFTTAGGNAANRIAKWDGSSWAALGSGMDYGTKALAVSDSDL